MYNRYRFLLFYRIKIYRICGKVPGSFWKICIFLVDTLRTAGYNSITYLGIISRQFG